MGKKKKQLELCPQYCVLTRFTLLQLNNQAGLLIKGERIICLMVLEAQSPRFKEWEEH